MQFCIAALCTNLNFYYTSRLLSDRAARAENERHPGRDREGVRGREKETSNANTFGRLQVRGSGWQINPPEIGGNGFVNYSQLAKYRPCRYRREAQCPMSSPFISASAKRFLTRDLHYVPRFSHVMDNLSLREKLLKNIFKIITFPSHQFRLQTIADQTVKHSLIIINQNYRSNRAKCSHCSLKPPCSVSRNPLVSWKQHNSHKWCRKQSCLLKSICK